MKKTLFLSALLLSTSLAGCGPILESTYTAPEITFPQMWHNNDDPSTSSQHEWWKDFNDEKLSFLVEDVLKQNNDLAVAALNVRKARLSADLAEDQFLPSFSGNASISDRRNLKGDENITRSYGLNGAVSYELDLWGKIARQSDAATWEAEATEQDRASAELSLIGTTIKLYWKIAYLNERIALSQQSIDYARKTLDLVKTQYKVGSVSVLEQSEAEQNLAAQEAKHTQYVQQLSETKNAFDILFNEPPGSQRANPDKLQKTIPAVPKTGIPSELLGRRPDLQAAEMRLKKALANTDATRASYLPSFTLTGSTGSSSIALSDVLKNPVLTLGAGLALPFLSYFSMTKNVDISDAEYEQTVISFRQSLYQAFSDVENALSARTNNLTQGEKLTEAYKKSKANEEIYELRYREGYSSLQQWLDAQEKRRTTESSVLENRYTQLVDAVTLYLAIGGDINTTKMLAP